VAQVTDLIGTAPAVEGSNKILTPIEKRSGLSFTIGFSL
jgi:hypothetical protein